ncbi:MAG: TIGR03885 family FMN-dependent LLM class oxidoreductase [Planctomycetota bacterium]|nr:TIGR03885 family FMN-dependent LLM class oxidoreductase [Planctomycetaceae bacterium]MDQ3329202.1 TIGR03885 family FMN-dependent LLM class oxidoreductase [Planctomycetota bacterium]
MADIGFHCSHELFPPSSLLRYARLAEAAGFRAAMCSDHFLPWAPVQGESGYSFAWLGAALASTHLPLGTICCPFGRYRPEIVAQAAATLAEMFPERFWLAIGTGQALNDHVTGEPWPPKSERQARLRESAAIIRALWSGETVTHRGRVTVEAAKLFTRPERPPLLFGAATTPETAKWVGSWADGLLTVNAEPDALRKVVDAFRAGGGEGKPMYLQAMVGHDPDEETAWRAAAKNWPIAVLDQSQLQNIETAEEMAAAAGRPGPGDMKEKKLRVSSDLSRHVAWIESDLALGFERVFLYTISGYPERFIETFGEQVLPKVSVR